MEGSQTECGITSQPPSFSIYQKIFGIVGKSNDRITMGNRQTMGDISTFWLLIALCRRKTTATFMGEKFEIKKRTG